MPEIKLPSLERQLFQIQIQPFCAGRDKAVDHAEGLHDMRNMPPNLLSIDRLQLGWGHL
jgi:hypothetical protein